MHLLMVISRDLPNWDVTAVSPADQWNKETLEGSSCGSAVDEENWLRSTETVCDETITCATVIAFLTRISENSRSRLS